MSFSYSGITNYGVATLPSVDSGLGSLYVVKDPPKSLFTRRIDKVGQTSSITTMTDESNNRSNEVINLYARGVNPCVSVSYGNEGNNGGQQSGSLVRNSGGSQAYLPYRIMDKGAFRPLVLTQEQLMPLSRQPRQNTTAFSQKGFTDFSKSLVCDNTNTSRFVKQETLKACIRPTATYRIDAPITEPFEVKYVIKNPVKFDDSAGISGHRTRDLTMHDIGDPTKEININPLHVIANSNFGSNASVRYGEIGEVSKGINDNPLHAIANSNLGSIASIRYGEIGEVSKGINENPLHVIPNSNLGSNASTRYGEIGEVSKGIDDNPLHAIANSNVGSSATVTYLDNSTLSTDRYTKDALQGSVESNPSRNIQILSIEDIIDLDIQVKDAVNISYTAPKSGNTKDEYIHNDIQLERRVVQAHATTNKQRNIHSRPEIEHIEHSQVRNLPVTRASTNNGTSFNRRGTTTDNNSRDYKLQQKINPGEFTPKGSIPMIDRMQQVNENRETDRSKMARQVMDMQHGRYNH